MASNNIGGHQKSEANNIGGHVEIISVISFIEETMKKINRFGEQLEIILDSNLTQ